MSILGIELKRYIDIKSKIFENNNGAIVLITKPGNSCRTKYIHTKHWFFKEHISADKSIILRKIETENLIVDIFTKRVKETLYVPLRNRLIEWED